MGSVFDAAAYLLQKAGGTMEQMPLHKLLYYGQGWALGNGRERLFPQRIEAWVNGPVVPELWAQQHHRFRVNRIENGNPAELRGDERTLLDAIWNTYGGFDGPTLSGFTHNESPWNEARRGIPEWSRSNAEITVDSLRRYFSGLVVAARAQNAQAARARPATT
jgi:uncharacterized phage-associated protein